MHLAPLMRKFLIQTLLNFIYPPLCLYCLNKKEKPERLFCLSCQCFLEPLTSAKRCRGCARLFSGGIVCPHCRENKWWEACLIPLYEKTPQLEKLIGETSHTFWIRERVARIICGQLPKTPANWVPLRKKGDALAEKVCQEMTCAIVGPYAPTYLFSTKRGEIKKVHEYARELKDKGALSVSLFYMICE